MKALKTQQSKSPRKDFQPLERLLGLLFLRPVLTLLFPQGPSTGEKVQTGRHQCTHALVNLGCTLSSPKRHNLIVQFSGPLHFSQQTYRFLHSGNRFVCPASTHEPYEKMIELPKHSKSRGQNPHVCKSGFAKKDNKILHSNDFQFLHCLTTIEIVMVENGIGDIPMTFLFHPHHKKI